MDAWKEDWTPQAGMGEYWNVRSRSLTGDSDFYRRFLEEDMSEIYTEFQVPYSATGIYQVPGHVGDRVKIVESQIREDQVEQAVAEVNKIIERMTETPITPIVEKTAVLAVDGGYQAHSESYFPLRMIVFVQSTGEHFELLRTGEAITWGSTPPPASLECWLVDVPHISWIGVKRA